MKASTTCFSIILGYCTDRLLVCNILSGDLTLPKLLQTIQTLSGNLNYFFIHPFEDDQLRLKAWKKASVQSAQATRSKNTKNVWSVLFTSHSKVLQLNMVLPDWIRLAACPNFNVCGNGKVVQSTDVHHFRLEMDSQNSICFINFPWVSCVGALDLTICICEAIWEEPRALISEFLPPKNPFCIKTRTYTHPMVPVFLCTFSDTTSQL